ncbi:class I SAM-dependent methyltransferase [Mobilitalea sibirica]|uniref:Class I SAM-dependent methyltransferase n=1 Tax=Mobilitalea sibirica TaxID=1462919 RepID=A0A8J7H5P4_9FIRM|nr:class I SAM-dependent methyltransferase [Mobilitalea sibirica]MBH1940276.1 class I SAM-dependent methyltransferase [Mobilitalea sibirica]
MPEEHQIAEERLYRIETQEVSLEKLVLPGRILDIGGGGEGIIGQIFKDRVIAIDPNPMELEEASEGPLKVVMDAKELKFLEASFDAITSFFTFMFIPNCDHQQVFAEVFRVLKPGGKFVVWDITIPPYDGGLKDIYVVPLKLCLPHKNVETGYGTRWIEKEQSTEYFCRLAEATGFNVDATQMNGQVMTLWFRR